MIMTPGECRRAYRFPSNRRNYATLEDFAAACGVNLSAQPAPKPEPKPPEPVAQARRQASATPAKATTPAHLAGDMTGEFRRALERMKTDTHQPETQTMTDKQPSGDAEARRKWDSDPQLRAEFGEDFERYRAFCKATYEGRAKVLNGGRAYGN
jgi:hypothetical protein